MLFVQYTCTDIVAWDLSKREFDMVREDSCYEHGTCKAS
jgi:hypothetical protein